MAGGNFRLGLAEDAVQLDDRLTRIESVLETLRAANPTIGIQQARVRSTPPAVSGLTVSSAPGGIALSWASTLIPDLLYYEVQASANSLFTPATTYRTFDTRFDYRIDNFSSLTYFRVRAVNSATDPGPWSSTVSSAVGSSVLLGGAGAFFDPTTNEVGRTYWDPTQTTNTPIDVFHDYEILQFESNGFQLIPFSQITLFIQFYYPLAATAINQATMSLMQKVDPANPSTWTVIPQQFEGQFISYNGRPGMTKSQFIFDMMFLPFTPPAGIIQYDLRVHIQSGVNLLSQGVYDNPCLAINPAAMSINFIEL